MSLLLLQNGADKLLLQNGTDHFLLQDGGGGGTGDEVLLSYFIAGGSKSEATMDDNVIALQRWADEDWMIERKPLFLIGDFYYFNDTVVWPAKTGLPCVIGEGGEPIWHSETVYSAPGLFGGPITAMVWGGSDYTKAMWVLDGSFGGVIDGVSFMGKQDPDGNVLLKDSESVDYPYDDPFNSHTGEDRCKYALVVNSKENIGSGKHHFPNGFHAILFQVAIYVSDDPEFPNHGDQCTVTGRTTFQFCDIGFWCNQIQAYFWRFDYVDSSHCTYPLLYDAGSKMSVGRQSIETTDVKAGLYLRGNDSTMTLGEFHREWVSFDEVVAPDSLSLHVEPTTGASAAATYDDVTHLEASRANNALGTPVYQETAGTFVAATGVFTANDAFDLSGITIGDWVFGRADGAATRAWVSRVTAINDGANTFTVNTTPHVGTLANLTGNATVAVFNPANERPVIRIVSSYGTHHFRRFRNAFDRMIHVAGGSSTNFPTIYLLDSMFAKGKHEPTLPMDIFTTNSSGYVCLRFMGNHEAVGDAGALNAGKFYTDQPQLWGTLTNGVFNPTP